jgi:hypothetical protein
MATTRTIPKSTRISLDRSIERMRKQLAELAQFLGKGTPTCCTRMNTPNWARPAGW